MGLGRSRYVTASAAQRAAAGEGRALVRVSTSTSSALRSSYPTQLRPQNTLLEYGTRIRAMLTSPPRTITLLVALATLASNVISSVLFSQLPDDPFHLAGNFKWYLHFANVLSVFGFLGSLRQHALSIAIFSNYLLLDTILCAIPRMLLLGLFESLSATLCASPPASPFAPDSISVPQTITMTPQPTSQWELLTSNWTPDGCYQIVRLTQLALAAGVVAGTVLQFVGALYVRDYARELWIREMREEALAIRAVEGGRYQIFLPGQDEEMYSDEELYTDEKF